MNTENTLIYKINQLPESLQESVATFVDFLLYKQAKEQESTTGNELSEEEKKSLETRHQSMQENPEKNTTVAELKDKIFKKYGQV